MLKTKVAYFEDSLGNTGTKINEFIEEQEKKDINFKLIDIKLSSSGNLYGDNTFIINSTIHSAAIVIYSFEEETSREEFKI
jgi:hypothetical protein